MTGTPPTMAIEATAAYEVRQRDEELVSASPGPMTCGEWLRRARLLADRTARDVADQAGIDSTLVVRGELGRRSFTVAQVRRVALALGLDPREAALRRQHEHAIRPARLPDRAPALSSGDWYRAIGQKTEDEEELIKAARAGRALLRNRQRSAAITVATAQAQGVLQSEIAAAIQDGRTAEMLGESHRAAIIGVPPKGVPADPLDGRLSLSEVSRMLRALTLESRLRIRAMGRIARANRVRRPTTDDVFASHVDGAIEAMVDEGLSIDEYVLENSLPEDANKRLAQAIRARLDELGLELVCDSEEEG